eukprot:COSAG03_NODE_12713_length_534_cov_6.806897_1_plen_42_part_10
MSCPEKVRLVVSERPVADTCVLCVCVCVCVCVKEKGGGGGGG